MREKLDQKTILSLPKIDLKSVGILFIIITLSTFILFLMIEVFLASELRSYLVFLENNSQYATSTTILYVGIIMIYLINTIISMAVLKEVKLAMIILNLATFIITLILFNIFILVYLQVIYPSFGSLSLIEKLGQFPNYFTYFAIYELYSPVLLWWIYLIFYNILLVILVKITIRVYIREPDKEDLKPNISKLNKKLDENSGFL